MKQFAFPLSIKCSDINWRKCAAIFREIGYDSVHVNPVGNPSDGFEDGMFIESIISDNAHHIDHFNPELISDIASVCTNDTWQKGELFCTDYIKLSSPNNNGGILGFEGGKVGRYGMRRPTLAEICEHHGYEIKGRDIVKKSEKISNCDKSYCETSMRLDEATAEINRLKSENAELNKKLEAVPDVDNQDIERLRSENAELKAQRIMCMEAFHAIKNRETKIKDLLEDIISDMY